jgi:transcriptional regulator with XRE-family HTH domain
MARRKSLSKELRSARERRGLSVAEVAGRVGVSHVSIYFWEAGRVRPRIENLKALCKVLKLPVRDALEATGV